MRSWCLLLLVKYRVRLVFCLKLNLYKPATFGIGVKFLTFSASSRFYRSLASKVRRSHSSPPMDAAVLVWCHIHLLFKETAKAAHVLKTQFI